MIGIINLTDLEKRSLQAVDATEVDRLIEKAIQEENVSALNGLPLSSCGEYVRIELFRFEQALRELRVAKSNRKREEALYRVRRARESLSSSVYGMKHRLAEDENEAELFRVNDHILHPHSFFSRTLDVRVSYQWRLSKGEAWNFGAITFTHEVKPRIPRYPQPQPKRKPSAAQQRRDLERELSDTWQRMMEDALYAVRDYFQEGRDGSLIPEVFKAKPDHDGYLNNFSLRFWK